MAGVLRSTTSRGTAQHNRGIKRKRSITQNSAACRYYLALCLSRIRSASGAFLSKPIRPIRKPPTHNPNRNRSRQRPPQRQSHVRHNPQQRERSPKDLPLHPSILAPRHQRLTHDVVPATSVAFKFASSLSSQFPNEMINWSSGSPFVT
jgi:hypothetical protein